MGTQPTGFEEAAEPYRFTLEDVFRMVEVGIIDEDARIELIDGEIIRMSPQSTPHARLKSRLGFLIRSRVPAEVEVIVDSTLKFSAGQAPEPDIFVLPRSSDPNGIEGSELFLIVEVADSSLRRDLTLKKALFERQGVPEYWVVDVQTGQTHVHTLSAGRYGAPLIVPRNEALAASRVPGLIVSIEEISPYA